MVVWPTSKSRKATRGEPPDRYTETGEKQNNFPSHIVDQSTHIFELVGYFSRARPHKKWPPEVSGWLVNRDTGKSWRQKSR